MSVTVIADRAIAAASVAAVASAVAIATTAPCTVA